MDRNQVDVLVIGGGIGGLATALALARIGRDVTVLERASEFGEIGAGLQLGPNASRMLDRLGVLSELEKTAVFPGAVVMMDAMTGEKVGQLDLGPEFVARYGYRYAVMHRSDLLAILLSACRADARITLLNNKQLAGVEEHPERACAICEDGSIYDAAVLIGADGLWSKVRTLFAPDEAAVCSEYVAYRGAVPMSDMSTHSGEDNVMLWAGPELHLVQYPVRRGELYNQVAVFRSHHYDPLSRDWGDAEELEQRFAPCCPAVGQALERILRNQRWPLYDRPPIAVWHRGAVALTGDAAHPMLQYLAQGAAQALEDAVALGECFATANAPAAALAAYQERRSLRTARVQLTAHLFGEICHIGGVGATLRNSFVAARGGTVDWDWIDWLYAAKPDARYHAPGSIGLVA